MTCEDCTTARLRTHGGYRPNCPGCIARSAARSLDAWHALHPKGNGDKTALRDQIGRRLSMVPVGEARRMVFEWWTHDREATTA